MSHNDNITKWASEKVEWEGAELILVIYDWGLHGHFMPPHYCGYVMFDKPMISSDMASYVINVHGGITYCEGNVYGFDCAHAFDGNDLKLRVPEDLFAECKRMKVQIEVAQKYERAFEESTSFNQRSEISNQITGEAERLYPELFKEDDFIDNAIEAMKSSMEYRWMGKISNLTDLWWREKGLVDRQIAHAKRKQGRERNRKLYKSTDLNQEKRWEDNAR